MSKETFCELLPPGIGNVNNLLKIPNKKEILPQSSNYRKESSPIVEKGNFSQETRKKLIDGGYFICELGNYSMKELLQGNSSIKIELHSSIYQTMKEENREIDSWHREIREKQRFKYGYFDFNTDIFNRFARKSEVAFHPKKFFEEEHQLFDSWDDEPFSKKVGKILASKKEKLRNNTGVEDVHLILGEAIDYVEAITQLVSTGKFIGKIREYGNYIATATYCGELAELKNNSSRLSSRGEYLDICIDFDSNKPTVELGHQCRCHPHGYIVPLIVPR